MDKQQQLYNIAVFDESILLSDFTGKGEQRYLVSEDELITLLQFERSVCFNTFPGLVQLQTGLDGHMAYIVSIKRHRRKLIHAERQKYRHITMELPNLLVKASVHKERIRVHDIWAYKGQLRNSAELFEVALPNMGGSEICMGPQDVKVKNGNIMKAIELILFETPFNHHRGIVSKDSLPFLDYIAKYKGKMPFNSLSSLGKAEQVLEAR